MSQPIEHLAEILSVHQDLHSRLLAFEEEKRDAIVANDVDRIAEISYEQECILVTVGKQEADRDVIMDMLRAEYDLPKEVKIDDVAKVAPEFGGRLLELRSGLKQVLEELHQRSEQNSKLLKICVRHIGDFFATINEARTVNPVYTRGGGSTGGQVRLFDKTA